MNEFYIGYLRKAPSGIARRIRVLVVVLFGLAVVCAILFAGVQRTYRPSTFEFGKQCTFEGLLEASPYPALLVSRPGAPQTDTSRYLLVAAGKHGADREVAAYAGKNVRLSGTLIYRDNQTMIELLGDSISVIDGVRPSLPAVQELGQFELVGEIVDSKCYFGVMNPGNGKVHRDCAVRCLSGGVPPVFVTNDFNGKPAALLLTGLNAEPFPKNDFLDRVARPVRIRGRVTRAGDTMFLRSEASAISRIR